jgi:subtilisin family serine protease
LCNCIAQEYYPNLLKVKLKSPSAKPEYQGRVFKGIPDASLNQTFEAYNVRKYYASMPFSKNENLRNTYVIEFDGDVNEFMNSLQTKHAGHFKGIKRVPKEIPLIEPTDYMYTDYQDWVWHIDNVQAPQAWDLTKGNENITIAIIDPHSFDVTHPDLCNKFVVNEDPYDGDPYGQINTGGEHHGTAMAGFLVAQTSGCDQYLSIGGYNFEIYAFETDGIGVDKALYASNVLGADIISISWHNGLCTPDPFGNDQAAIQEILDNGTVICAAAGNGDCGGGFIYPFTPDYDSRIICSSSIDENNNHDGIDQNGNNILHSHYPEVDLCAPGIGTMRAGPSGGTSWPYYGNSNGTSNTAPQVAATVALMLSLNPCLSVQDVEDVIVNTTLPIADAASFPGQVGSGRLNTYQAVVEAIDQGTIEQGSSMEYTGTATLEAPTVFKTQGKVKTDADIKFKAPREIVLGGGFEVEAGAEFKTIMDYTCSF